MWQLFCVFESTLFRLSLTCSRLRTWSKSVPSRRYSLCSHCQHLSVNFGEFFNHPICLKHHRLPYRVVENPCQMMEQPYHHFLRLFECCCASVVWLPVWGDRMRAWWTRDRAQRLIAQRVPPRIFLSCHSWFALGKQTRVYASSLLLFALCFMPYALYCVLPASGCRFPRV